MFFWLQKLSQPALCLGLGSSLYLGTAAHLTLTAYSLPWFWSPTSRENAQLDSPVLSSSSREGQALLTQGFHSLAQYCQSPSPPPSPSSPTSPSSTPEQTAAPPCPNWLTQEPPPEAKDLATEKKPSQFPFIGFFNSFTAVPAQTTPLSPEVPTASAFPQLHRQAKLARVPIFMYHDILPQKKVFFDVTPQELEAHFQRLQKEGVTPISPDWLLAHLRTGVPLPAKPVLLTFDDGYGGHYQYVYPLLKKYGYPAVFSIYIEKMKGKTGRTSLTWEQLQEMAANPLVTVASHSMTHPKDLRELSDDELYREVMESKRILEQRLGIPIAYFTYPEGHVDARVKQWVIAAGYQMAFSMDDLNEKFAGESPDLLTLGRFGQSRLAEVAPQAWGGYPAPVAPGTFNFATPIEKREYTVDGTEVILISGGKPQTIHADSRYQVPEIIKDTGAVAGVDGGFFSLKFLDSNTMIGPVFSGSSSFIPGNEGENLKLRNRPLALISSQSVKFIPFVPELHNTLAGIQQESPDGNWVTDAFVGAAWLVREGKPQPGAAFGSLFDYDAARHRAFWGINQAGQPTIGVTKTPVGSVSLGRILSQLGLREAMMLDSGASTSLAYEGESLVGYTPRPVPHAVVLYPAAQEKRESTESTIPVQPLARKE